MYKKLLIFKKSLNKPNLRKISNYRVNNIKNVLNVMKSSAKDKIEVKLDF